MKASEEIIKIAEQIFIDLGQGKMAVLPEGWKISCIDKDNKTITLLIPTEYKNIKKEDVEIPFHEWIYLLFKSTLKDLINLIRV